MKKFRLPSPAMVVAVISLIVAVGGTAAALPGSGTVGPDDLKRDSVGARALGKVLLAYTDGLASTDPVAKDGLFTEVDGTIECPQRFPFAFDPSIANMGPLSYQVSRRVVVNRFGGPGGYTFRVLSDAGPIGYTMTVNCLARR
jgi:hypothetical protein